MAGVIKCWDTLFYFEFEHCGDHRSRFSLKLDINCWIRAVQKITGPVFVQVPRLLIAAEIVFRASNSFYFLSFVHFRSFFIIIILYYLEVRIDVFLDVFISLTAHRGLTSRPLLSQNMKDSDVGVFIIDWICQRVSTISRDVVISLKKYESPNSNLNLQNLLKIILKN